MRTPFDLIKALQSWFFAKDGDVILQSGRTIIVTDTGVTVTIDSNGVSVTGTGDVTVGGTSVSLDGHSHAVSIAHADTTGQTEDDHHNRQHALDSASDHTGTLPWNDLSKTGSDLADLATRAHGDLTGVTADQHHNESHTVASHSDTSATGSELNTLTDGSDASTLHDHDGIYYRESEFDDAPGASSAPLETNSSGNITIYSNYMLGNCFAGLGLIVGSTSVTPTDRTVTIKERTSTPTPSSGYGAIYFKSSDSRLYYKTDGGTEYGPL